MKLKELKEYLNSLPEGHLEKKFMIPIFKPGTLGGTPSIEITSISLGFDWNQDAAFAETGEELTTLNTVEISAIIESVRKGQSYHAMKQIEDLQQRIKSICPHCGHTLDVRKAQKESRIEKQLARIHEINKNNRGDDNG